MNELRWRWLRWRVRHYVWLAQLAWYQHPCDTTKHAYHRAFDLLERVETARP